MKDMGQSSPAASGLATQNRIRCSSIFAMTTAVPASPGRNRARSNGSGCAGCSRRPLDAVQLAARQRSHRGACQPATMGGELLVFRQWRATAGAADRLRPASREDYSCGLVNVCASCWKVISMSAMKTLGPFDYVIVGGGTAGCVLANRLSADPDVKVLLLEAGGKDDWIWIHIPVGYLYCIGNPRTDWCYRTEPEPGLNGRSILYARGKVLGGCSSINAMLYLRGQKEDYDGWARLTGDPGWSWGSVLPIFKRSEDHHLGASEAHGAGGEWRVERQRLSWKILEAFREAMAQAGIPKIDDFNRGDNEGCAFFEVNQRRGVRWNATKGFLRPAMNRPNLTVMTDVLVKRVRLDGRRAAGIELLRAGQEAFAEARIETILAAGAIGSPQILQLSGIGPAAALPPPGIPVPREPPR